MLSRIRNKDPRKTRELNVAATAQTDGSYFDPLMETLPRQDLERLQWESLVPIFTLAYEHAGLIRQKWDAAGITPRDIKSLTDYFRLVPFITKDDLRLYRQETGDAFGGVSSARREANCELSPAPPAPPATRP